jgi:hypothetical protein
MVAFTHYESNLVNEATRLLLRNTPEMREHANTGELWIKRPGCLSIVPDDEFQKVDFEIIEVSDVQGKDIPAPWTGDTDIDMSSYGDEFQKVEVESNDWEV